MNLLGVPGLLVFLVLLLLLLGLLLEVGFRTRVFIERGVWGGESGLKRKLVVRALLGFSLRDPTPGLHQCVDKDRTCALCKF